MFAEKKKKKINKYMKFNNKTIKYQIQIKENDEYINKNIIGAVF